MLFTSWLIVEGARCSDRAMARMECQANKPREISSRSAELNVRAALRCAIDATPPARRMTPLTIEKSLLSVSPEAVLYFAYRCHHAVRCVVALCSLLSSAKVRGAQLNPYRNYGHEFAMRPSRFPFSVSQISPRYDLLQNPVISLRVRVAAKTSQY